MFRSYATALLLTAMAAPGACGWTVTYTVSPGDDALAAMDRLQPGDTLQLQGGTYPPPPTTTADSAE